MNDLLARAKIPAAQTVFSAILTLIPVQALLAVDVGQKAPECVLNGLSDGQSYDAKALRGKVVYIDFWASWCGPCAKSFPFLAELSGDLKDKGLEVIGVNLDENLEDAKTFVSQFPVNFMLAKDSTEQCASAYDVKAMPSSYLIGRDGIVRHVHMGFRSDESAELRKTVEALLAEKPAGG